MWVVLQEPGQAVLIISHFCLYSNNQMSVMRSLGNTNEARKCGLRVPTMKNILDLVNTKHCVCRVSHGHDDIFLYYILKALQFFHFIFKCLNNLELVSVYNVKQRHPIKFLKNSMDAQFFQHHLKKSILPPDLWRHLSQTKSGSIHTVTKQTHHIGGSVLLLYMSLTVSIPHTSHCSHIQFVYNFSKGSELLYIVILVSGV